MRQIENAPKASVSVRFWIELGLGILSALAVVVTFVWPQWIENVFGTDLDAGSGDAEWALIAGLCAFTVAMFILARREWIRAAMAVASANLQARILPGKTKST